MKDEQLNALWTEVTRTAKPGARVVFRTADLDSLLPGRLDQGLLDQWTYLQETSKHATATDRSAIYGGVHVYEFTKTA
jgi:S-adenosylmethionine:diacylglycerol 3-amino-3-carboxypropyl transferase